MEKPGVKQQLNRINCPQALLPALPDSRVEVDYVVKTKSNPSAGTHILELYFGSLWKLALSQIAHQMDGYLLTLQHKGQEFKVFRNIEPKTAAYPKLRLVS